MRQDRREGYTEDWAVVAPELQSQLSSQATPGPAHRIQTPSSLRIVTLVWQQDSQNDSQDTDLSFDFLQTSAARVVGFLHSSPPSSDGSREVSRALSLDRTVSPTPSRCLSLRLDEIEPAQQKTSDSEWGDVEQVRNRAVHDGN